MESNLTPYTTYLLNVVKKSTNRVIHILFDEKYSELHKHILDEKNEADRKHLIDLFNSFNPKIESMLNAIGQSNNPKILYKYRVWEDDYDYHRELLINNRLYLANPVLFNDPFDSLVLPNFKKSKKSTSKKFIKSLIPDCTDNDLNLFIDNLDILHEPVETQNKILETIGLCSFSTKWENIKMWSHYANRHQGFCLGLNKLKVFECFRANSKYTMSSLVNYENNFPDVETVEKRIEMLKNSKYFGNLEDINHLRSIRDILLKFFTKHIDWKYEQEYRFLGENITNDNDRIITFTDDCIEEVIIGLSATEKTKKEIKQICKERGIKCYQAVKVPFEFRIEKVLVS